jgi:hypothetical protein
LNVTNDPPGYGSLADRHHMPSIPRTGQRVTVAGKAGTIAPYNTSRPDKLMVTFDHMTNATPVHPLTQVIYGG